MTLVIKEFPGQRRHRCHSFRQSAVPRAAAGVGLTPDSRRDQTRRPSAYRPTTPCLTCRQSFPASVARPAFRPQRASLASASARTKFGANVRWIACQVGDHTATENYRSPDRHRDYPAARGNIGFVAIGPVLNPRINKFMGALPYMIRSEPDRWSGAPVRSVGRSGG